ncbi:MAG: hypothetical protein ACLUD2_05455 [Clostridium sp.]
MDAEKVASCIELIRGPGIPEPSYSATNDKIQNYRGEPWTRSFVFANPNKKNISIQEFSEKRSLSS